MVSMAMTPSPWSRSVRAPSLEQVWNLGKKSGNFGKKSGIWDTILGKSVILEEKLGI